MKLRKSLKTITSLEDERDTYASTLATLVAKQDVLVKNAARAVSIKERQHYTSVVAAEKDKVNAKDIIIDSLTDQCIKAKRGLEKGRRDGNQSARRADDVQGTLATTKKTSLCIDELRRKYAEGTQRSPTDMQSHNPSSRRNGGRRTNKIT